MQHGYESRMLSSWMAETRLAILGPAGVLSRLIQRMPLHRVYLVQCSIGSEPQQCF